MNENICLSCGFCCDGTVIGVVRLNREEVSISKELMDIEEVNGEGFFLQPCDKLSCNGCTIYPQRPKQCASFNCGLLGALNQKKIDFDSAIEVIDLVKRKKAVITEKLETLHFELKSPSFHFKMIELKKIMLKNQSEISSTQDLSELISEIKKLDMLMSKEFGLSLF
ncbi:MAG: YkgJ family cysteine cluster protein [Marinoscillum sp.]